MSQKTRVPVRRKVLFVNLRMQLLLIGYGLLFSLISAFLALLSTSVNRSSENMDSVVSHTLALMPVLVFFIGLALFSCIVTVGLILTHRVFGPLYRLHREIKAMANGQKGQPIQLRKGDALKELIADFNLLIEKIEKSK